MMMMVGLTAGVLMPPAAEALYTGPSDWATAAATIGFPVLRPAVTLGMGAGKVTLGPCDGKRQTLGATWSARGGRRMALHEDFPKPCGDNGPGRLVRTATVGGTRVRVLVNCGGEGRCAATAADGYARGFQVYLRAPGARRTYLELTARHVVLADVLRVVRSLARVPADGDRVQVDAFLSPDRKVWCVIAAADGGPTWCDTQGRPAYGATLTAGGAVTLCVAQALCTQNWQDDVPVLRAGQTTTVHGVRCTAGDDATVTCSATASGRGFVVGAATARAL